MTIRVAINGYGRIGRNILRAHYENGKKHDIEIVAINDLGDPKTNAHLTRFDTAHGKFPGTVTVDGDYMVVNGDKIRVLANRNPAELPWGELGVDVVLECTGFFTSKEKAGAHLKGGAKKVIISAPGGKDVDAQLAPRQFGRVAVGQDANAVAVDHHVVAIDLDRARELAVRRIVAGEMDIGLGVAQVVDGHDFNIVLLAIFVVSAQDVASDTAIAVDCYANCHDYSPVLQNLFDGLRHTLGGQSKMLE